jgi:hypothetical protein
MSETKNFKHYLWQTLYSISGIGLCVAVLSRDVRLQSFLVNPQSPPEFSYSNLLCNDFPRCGRISGELFGISILTIFKLSATLFNNNSFWKNYYISNEDFVFLIENATSLTFRVLCLIPILILCYRFVGKSLQSMFLVMISFTILLSGFPLYYINNLFGIYLVNYDYMVLFMVGILLLNFDSIFKSQVRILILTIILTLTFENLPLIVIIIIFRTIADVRERIKLLTYVCLTSAVTYLVYLFLVMTNNQFEISIESDGRYFSKNLLNFAEITVAILMFLGVAFLLGISVSILSARISKKSSYQNFSSTNLTNALISILYAYGFSILFGFFISGLTEFSRQLMPLQLVLFLIGLSSAAKVNERLSKIKFYIAR